MMKLTIAVLAAVLCLAHSNPLPEPAESIDLVNIPLSDNKELDILTLAEADGTINERNKRTIGILRELFPQLSQVRAVDEENILEPSSAGSDAILDTIRVAREINNLNNKQDNKINNDQNVEASEAKDQVAEAQNQAPSIEELSLDSIEDDENRGKRFLVFGGATHGANGSGSAGGSGAGSGNFLFDIIRQTADRVARGAGSAFRVVAGTETLDAALKNINAQTHEHNSEEEDFKRSTRSGNFSLVSGSSGTQQQDERANAPDDGSASAGASASTNVGQGDGYTEGIPGPVTRLFVLANRGLSNLIQDLILRIAQTSERVVNFKARLITSLI